MIETIIGVLGIVVILLIVRPITTFIHELGHAIPALIFTNEKVVIYVGSYGDTDKSLVFRIGRLYTLFRYKITDWQLGLCWHSRTYRTKQDMLIVLGGPLFSLMLGIFSYYLITRFHDQSYVSLMLVTILVSSVLDFFVNIIPNEQPLEMHDGNFILNDGSQLRKLILQLNYPPVYFEGLQLLETGQKEAGITKIKSIIEDGQKDISLYRMIIDLLKSEPEKAIEFNDQYFRQFNLMSPDFKSLGDIYRANNDAAFAIQCYTKAIGLNYRNAGALLNRAKSYMDVDLPQKALEDLKIVLLIEDNEEALALQQQLLN